MHAGAASLGLHWSFEPGVVAPLVIGAAWYACGAVRLARARGEGAARSVRRGPVLFAAAIATLIIALVSPLDGAAETIFSAHMMQHLLLILVAAPLAVLASPVPELWWGIPHRARVAVARGWRRSGHIRAVWHAVSAPWAIFALHVAALWFWHFPGPYEAALRSDGVHALEHLSFFGTALLYWWVVFQPSGHRRLSYPAGVIYVTATMLQSGALGGLLMYAARPWYPMHAAGAAAWGLTLLEDQQIAGLVMWIPAGFVYIGVAVWLAHEWLRDDERRTVRAEEALRVARVATLVLCAMLAGAADGCTKSSADAPKGEKPVGDAANGARLIREYGCGSCHVIPGIEKADGLVGPPLTDWSERRIIAGRLPNDPEHLVNWISAPQSVEPGTAMPNMNVNAAQARDMAAYLYSLK